MDKNWPNLHIDYSGTFFAFRLENMLALRSMGLSEEQYAPELARRQADFITCLIGGRQSEFIYDLRYLVRDHATPGSAGACWIVLIGRVRGMLPEAVEHHANGLLGLMTAQFREAGFARLHAAEINDLLRPFPVGFATRVVRRTSLEDLDTLVAGIPRPTPSFVRGVASGADSGNGLTEKVLHTYPFVPAEAPQGAVLQALVDLGQPICVSVRLRPASITPGEEALLEHQIASCEKYSQMVLGVAPEDPSSLRPTLRRQADAFERYQARKLFGLRDNAVLMTVEVLSTAPVPAPILEMVGSSISRPAGAPVRTGGDLISEYLAGGYDIIELPAQVAAHGMENLEFSAIESDVTTGTGRLLHLFDSLEARAAFRFPAWVDRDFQGVELRAWRTLPPPRSLPTKGTLLGLCDDPTRRVEARVSAEDRRRHVYVVGQTGTGKTTLLRSMILSDIEDGQGVCVIDPHGDLFADLLGRIPDHRIDDVAVLDPTDTAYPVGLNLLESQSEEQAYFVAQEFAGIVGRLVADEYGDRAVAEFMGPIFFEHLRMNLLLLMSKPDKPATLIDLHRIFSEKNYWKGWTPLTSNDPLLRAWVEVTLPTTDYPSRSRDNYSLGDWIRSKLDPFVFDPRLRHMFAQPCSTLDLRRIMDDGKILLVNLAKGHLTEKTSRFLGMVLMAKLIATALARIDRGQSERRPFSIYVDEFQNVATTSFATLLSEARKFGVSLVLANQFLSQVRDRGILDAIFGNVGTTLSLRVGQADAELLERQFAPEVSKHDLVWLPNWRAYARTQVGGCTVPVFSLRTLAEASPYQEATAHRVRERSRQQFAVSASDMERIHSAARASADTLAT